VDGAGPAVVSSRSMVRRRESFPVHTYEVDAFGQLSTTALAAYLQEIAGHHAEELGVGVEALRARGQAWVLGRQRLEVLRPVGEGEVLEVETWPSGANRLLALRDFVVRGAGGAEAARATTAWLVIDLETRRPLRPDRVLEPQLHPEVEHPLPPPEGKLPELGAAVEERRLPVRYQDIDGVMHVNNTSVLAWALEAAPEETWRSRRLAALEALYLAECRPGGAVLSRAASSGDGVLLHSVVREEDGRELARFRTAWAPRSAAAGGARPGAEEARGGRP